MKELLEGPGSSFSNDKLLDACVELVVAFEEATAGPPVLPAADPPPDAHLGAVENG